MKSLNWKIPFLGVVIASTGFLLACSDDEDDTGNGSGGTGNDTDASMTDNLYTRLGEHSGIRTAIDAIVAEELKDAEIASFFGAVGTAGHPTKDQIAACFTDLLGKAAGGPEAYPTMESGFQCRSMTAAHAGLHIPAPTFDKFVVIAAGVLKSAGVADTDITTIGGVLNGTKGDIVDPAAGMPEAGSPDSSVDSLYSRLGGHAGIRTAIDAIVAAELMDTEIASFFGAVGTEGHPTADQIEECFTNLLGKAAGGPEAYPSMGNGFQCRGMAAAHAGLHIPASTFDKFVVIAAGVLKSAGVADDDITAIGGVLNGTKGDIVDPNAIAPDAGGDGG
jgi:hypothetical protein